MEEKIKDLSVSLRLLILAIVIFSLAYSGIIGIVGHALWGDQAGGSLVRRNGKVVGSELIGQEFDEPEFFHGRVSSIDDNAMKSGSQNLAPQENVLFSIEAESIKNNLNQGELPEELREKFDNLEYPLPGDAEVVQWEDEWIIKSGDKSLYHIREDGEKLEIYKKSKLARRVKSILSEFSEEYENSNIPSDLVTESGSALDPHITVRGALFQVPRIARNTELSEPELRSLVENHSKNKLLGLYGMKRVNVLELNLELENRMERGG